EGSLKRSRFAKVVPAGIKAPFSLVPRASQNGGGNLKVTTSGNSMIVDTGALKCVISTTTSPHLFESMSIGNLTVVGNAQLVCILQNGTESDPRRLTHT